MPLRPGDRVFVGVSGWLSNEIGATALAQILALGLEPHLDKGVPPSQGRLTSNIQIEAARALQHCQVLIVLAGDPIGDRPVNVALDELGPAVDRGVPAFLYVVSTNAPSADVPPGVTSRLVADAAEFAGMFDRDLHSLMAEEKADGRRC